MRDKHVRAIKLYLNLLKLKLRSLTEVFLALLVIACKPKT